MNDIQGTQKVWLSDTSRLTPLDIQAAIDAGEQEYILGWLQFSDTDMSRYGWAEIGTAKIEVAFHPQEAVIEKLAEGLRNQISVVRAEAQQKVAHLEEKLNQLLALPNRSAIEEGETA